MFEQNGKGGENPIKVKKNSVGFPNKVIRDTRVNAVNFLS